MSSSAGPPRPGSWLAPPVAQAAPAPTPPAVPGGAAVDDLATSLSGVPVSAHADVLAAEHDRLHRLLATIDQL